MENNGEKLEASNPAESYENTIEWLGTDFREDLAFPTMTEDMVERLRAFGDEEFFPANVKLYTHGDRQIDMFVVLDGGVDIIVPSASGGSKTYARHRKFNFTGEFNLLTSQRAVVEARTATESNFSE
jgi:thioredoxin reductase (NADPH)